MGGLSGVPERGSAVEWELEAVGHLTGFIGGGPGCTLCSPWNDSLVFDCAEGWPFETCHTHNSGGHILPTVARDLEIIGLHGWSVGNDVSCWIENSYWTEERLEMAVVMASYHAHAADDIHWCVSQIDCLSQWQVVNNYLRILIGYHSIVASQIDHLVEPCSLSLVEIHLSTCSATKDAGKPL